MKNRGVWQAMLRVEVGFVADCTQSLGGASALRRASAPLLHRSHRLQGIAMQLLRCI